MQSSIIDSSAGSRSYSFLGLQERTVVWMTLLLLLDEVDSGLLVL